MAFLGYPLGFVAVILGRQQLFTENTLFPVALALRERSMLGPTARLWGLVLAGNVVGAVLFAVLGIATPSLPTAYDATSCSWAWRPPRTTSGSSCGPAWSPAG